MFLNQLKTGQKAKIIKMDADDSIKRRLLDMGMIEGTVVQSVFKSPFNDPVSYLVRGTLIAIRNADIKNVLVEVLDV